MFKLSDYNFELPNKLIAKYPPEKRTMSRLLMVDKANGTYQDGQFIDILDTFNKNDLIIFNNTKVIPARIFSQKETGGQIEILIERLLDKNNVLAHIKASKALKPGAKLLIENQTMFQVIEKQKNLYHITATAMPVLSLLLQYGHMPLPPYMAREAETLDNERYQTVYAEIDGSVAAPTAGLHFDENLLQALKDKGVDTSFVTLHVGAGTFQPVRDEDITKHEIHHEWLNVSDETCQKIKNTKAKGGRVICVGTTSVRSIETAATGKNKISPFIGDTNLFIYPGYDFKVVDAMITNFHLPKSSLLMLVSAFAGFDLIKTVYQHAIDEEYRFFSYGDAMFLY